VSAGGRTLGWIVALLAVLCLAFEAQAASAEIIAPQNHPQSPADGWQAGTCNTDTPECSVATPGEFFEQAAGHPQIGFTQFIVKEAPKEVALGLTVEEPVGDIKDVRVDLPVGLSVNPEATPQCSQATFEATPLSCPIGSNVGESFATAALLGVNSPQIPATVYNIEPAPGEPARFGFNLLGNNVYLKAGVAWESDYHEFFTIEAPTSPVGHVLKNRLVFNGRAGNGTFITTPTTCYDSTQPAFKHVYSTYLRADSVQQPDPSFPNGSAFIESELPPNTNPKECDTVPFKPSVGTTPNTPQTDSPDGAAVEIAVPFEVPLAPELALPFTKQASSQLKTAKVALPQGMGLNPSAANSLQTCTDAQFGKGTRNAVGCPAASKIGVVAVETPPLPAGSLKGNVYVGKQLSRDPLSGNEYRVFVDAESSRHGISARLIGNVSADPQTGQLTTTFANNPQVPFSSFKLDFDDGAKAVLTSPPTCGPNTTSTQITPWSGSADATPSGKFSLTKAPGGGACAKTMAERPFAPIFAAKSTNPEAGAYSQVNVNVARSDGNQELKGVNVDLPPGLTAKLKGVTYCPAAKLVAAAASSGIDQEAKSSCPDSSLVGSVAIESGTGPNPIHIAGKAFLAGPYHGAPLSLAVVTPATAGPFDLGTVVVRVALFVDPDTAQVQAVSDPIPHVYGGALLDVRSIALKIDRKQFALNPTNCAPMAFAGALKGGGADPNNSATFSTDPISSPLQVNNCNKLGFKPKLHLRLFGKTHRNQHPRFRAVLAARSGDANIKRASVALPHALFLDQASLSSVCTRDQFAAHKCPKRSIYGHATAISPLLDKPLKGPVYLRSSNNLLPDLVAALHGQVDIDLDGRIDSFHGGIRTTYDAVPDVPVTKFTLTLPGGKHGLLVASRNLCQKAVKAIVQLKGQNGKKANRRPKLRTPCKGKQHGKRLHHHNTQ
jgi:hypothetical protein